MSSSPQCTHFLVFLLCSSLSFSTFAKGSKLMAKIVEDAKRTSAWKKWPIVALGALMAFGEPNCERFKTKDIFDRFDEAGKLFINCTSRCLIENSEQYIRDHRPGINCSDLQSAAFDGHPGCYLRCGFCKVCKTNKGALLHGYRLSDFWSREAIRQVMAVIRECGIFNCLL